MLPVNKACDAGVSTRSRQKSRVEDWLCKAVTLGFAATTAGHDVEQFRLQQGLFRYECPAINAQQDLTCLNGHALLDKDFADRTAIGMLHQLPVPLHLDPAVDNDRP